MLQEADGSCRRRIVFGPGWYHLEAGRELVKMLMKMRSGTGSIAAPVVVGVENGGQVQHVEKVLLEADGSCRHRNALGPGG